MNTDNSSHGFVLQVRGLSKSFPGVQALAGVQLNVAAGEVYALMGENGVGKSTLMKIVSGLDQPDEGDILLKGRAVRFRSPHPPQDRDAPNRSPLPGSAGQRHQMRLEGTDSRLRFNGDSCK